jgi:hypothetical protein
MVAPDGWNVTDLPKAVFARTQAHMRRAPVSITTTTMILIQAQFFHRPQVYGLKATEIIENARSFAASRKPAAAAWPRS